MAMRLAKSIVTGLKDVELRTQSINKNQAEVERLAGIADAEKLNTILETADLVQEQQSILRKRDEELSRLLQNLQQPVEWISSYQISTTTLESNQESKS
jgi:hypothetical protein